MKIHFGDIFLVKFHPVIGSELKRYCPAIVENDALDKTSTLLLWYLKTVDVIRLERKLGKLDVNETVQIKKILNKVLC